MNSAQVLIQVLLAREAFSRVTLAVGVRAVHRLLGATVLAVNFTFVSKKTP